MVSFLSIYKLASEFDGPYNPRIVTALLPPMTVSWPECQAIAVTGYGSTRTWVVWRQRGYYWRAKKMAPF